MASSFIKKLYKYRHFVFFGALVLTIFFSDLFLHVFGEYELVASILLLLLGTLPMAGYSRTRRSIAFSMVILVAFLAIPLSGELNEFNLVLFIILFVYYIYITVLLFTDILRNKEVSADIILGAFSGYILLGMIGFFVFSFLIIIDPNTLNIPVTFKNMSDVMYFSFVTMSTIGYGDLTPNTRVAEKIAVLLGLCGQFYIATVMAILVGKFLSKGD